VIWDVARRSVTAILPGNGSPVISVAFSPDGSRVATTRETADCLQRSQAGPAAVSRSRSHPMATRLQQPDRMDF
jgi:WD40 repeat protein